MTCKQCETQLNALADGALPSLRAGPVRCHLAQCRDCAKAYAEIVQLGNEARSWRAAVPPAALAVRIALALPPQTARMENTTMISERPLARPKQTAPRLVFAAALCLAALALFALWPGSPGRPALAYADVVRAMQQVQTLHCYGRIETTASGKRGVRTSAQSTEYWAVLGPRVEDARAAVRMSTPLTWPGRNQAGWEISPMRGAALRVDLMRLLWPPSGGAEDVMGVKVGGPAFTPWQQDTVQQDGKARLRFQHRAQSASSEIVQTVLIDPQTRLVVSITDRRRVQFPKSTRSGAALLPSSIVTIYHLNRFEYNHAPPAEVFAPPAPAKH